MNGDGRYTGDIMALRGRYAQLAGQATEKMVSYHGSLTETLAGVNRPIDQAPPLVGGHGDIQGLSGDVPLAPPPDPPHGKDPRYWVDVSKIIYVPDGQLAPHGYTQIGSGLWYPSGSPYDHNDPPAAVQHPLDNADIVTTAPGKLGPPGTEQLVPGYFVPDPDAFYQPAPPWTPKEPIDIRDVIQVPHGQLAPWGYVEDLPGFFAPGPELTNIRPPAARRAAALSRQ